MAAASDKPEVSSVVLDRDRGDSDLADLDLGDDDPETSGAS